MLNKGFVTAVFRVFCLALLAAVAPGCGGGGSGGGSSSGSSKVAKGSVALPSGFKLNLNQLAVNSEAGQVPVNANGSFSAPVSSTGPRMAQLVDTTTDKIVMLGYVDSGSGGSSYAGGKGQINATTTASALLFAGLGGPMLSSTDRQAYLSSIATSTEVQTVASTVTKSVAVNPTAISDGDSGIVAAVAAVQNSATGSAQREAVQASSNSVTRFIVRTSGAGTLVNVDPSTPQSNLVVQPNPEGNGIVFVNSLRRRGSVFIYEVAKGQTASTTTPLSQPIEFVSGQGIDPEIALTSGLATIYNGLHGKFTFLPKTSGPIELSSDQGSPVTVYDVVVVGPGGQNTLASVAAKVWPSSTSEQTTLVNEWSDSVLLTTAKSLGEDVVLPLFFSFIMSPSQGDTLAENPTLDSDVEALAKSLTDVAVALKKGDVKAASGGFIDDVLKTPNAKQAFIQLLKNAVVNSGLLSSGNLDKMLERLSAAGTVMQIVDKSFLAIDIARIYSDSFSSDMADTWTATVLPAKVTLNPTKGVVNTDNSIASFTVQLQGETDLSKFKFEWSAGGTMGTLEEPNDPVAMPTGLTNFSGADYVADLTKLKSGASDSVTVKVFDEGGNSIGEATAMVVDQEGQENEIPYLDTSTFPTLGPGYGSVWNEENVISVPLVKGATKYTIEMMDSQGRYGGTWYYNTATGNVTSEGLNGPEKWPPFKLNGGTLLIAYDGNDSNELNDTEQQIQLQIMEKGRDGWTAIVLFQ